MRENKGCDEVNQSKTDCHPELVSGSYQHTKKMLNVKQSRYQFLKVFSQNSESNEMLRETEHFSRNHEISEKVVKQVQHDTNCLYKKVAFTLAEVLITLSILGVVAVLAISNIIGHFKKLYTETRLKQAYSILENAVEISKVENGGLTNMFTSGVNFTENYILPYLNYTEYCASGVSAQNCNIYRNHISYFKSLDGSNCTGANCVTYAKNRLKLKNGMVIFVWMRGEVNPVYFPGAYYLNFIVDINGDKEPNRLGYDVFYFMLGSPSGCSKSNNQSCNQGDRIYATYERTEVSENDNSKNCTGIGVDCSSPIKRNGWKIPKDYPVKF